MKKLLARVRGVFVKMGWGLYRFFNSLKDFGERKRVAFLVNMGKRGMCIRFPAK